MSFDLLLSMTPYTLLFFKRDKFLTINICFRALFFSGVISITPAPWNPPGWDAQGAPKYIRKHPTWILYWGKNFSTQWNNLKSERMGLEKGNIMQEKWEMVWDGEKPIFSWENRVNRIKSHSLFSSVRHIYDFVRRWKKRILRENCSSTGPDVPETQIIPSCPSLIVEWGKVAFREE